MTRHPVVSAAIRSVGHEGDVLEVEMMNGKVYRYRGVTPEHHQAFIGAESIGRHFNQVIARQFTHEIVEPEVATT